MQVPRNCAFVCVVLAAGAVAIATGGEAWAQGYVDEGFDEQGRIALGELFARAIRSAGVLGVAGVVAASISLGLSLQRLAARAGRGWFVLTGALALFSFACAGLGSGFAYLRAADMRRMMGPAFTPKDLAAGGTALLSFSLVVGIVALPAALAALYGLRRAEPAGSGEIQR